MIAEQEQDEDEKKEEAPERVHLRIHNRIRGEEEEEEKVVKVGQGRKVDQGVGGGLAGAGLGTRRGAWRRSPT